MSTPIPREKYLKNALSLTEEEITLMNFYSSWLPKDIIDCHAHCNLKDHFMYVEKRAYNHMLSTFPYFSLEESKKLRKLFFPGKRVRTIRFPKTFKGINHKQANAYLLDESTPDDLVAVFGLPEDYEYTIEVLSDKRAVALKMYHSYLDPPAKEIYEYFPKEILEVAQFLGKPIILHTPVRIDLCLNQVLDLIRDFPRLKICIAHLGLTKHVVAELEKAFSAIKPYAQVNFDTSLVPSSEVVKLALEKLGTERIMFGSDEPLNLIRSYAYNNPDLGQRIVTDIKYHWTLESEYNNYGHLARKSVHAHWQCLEAIRKAIEISPGDKDTVKENIFYNNSKHFYSI